MLQNDDTVEEIFTLSPTIQKLSPSLSSLPIQYLPVVSYTTLTDITPGQFTSRKQPQQQVHTVRIQYSKEGK